MIDFPNTPTIGQTFAFGGKSFTWDGTKWLPAGLAGGPFVSQAGFTPASNMNRIINGDFRIDQRNGGAQIPFVTGAFGLDRWLCASSGPTGKLAVGRSGGPSTQALGIPWYMAVISTSAYTPLAADTQAISQPIEADMVADTAFGTAGAVPLTLSFWCNSTMTGTFSGSLASADGSRSFPFTFPVSNQSGLQKVVINIPGCTDGTWVLQGSARSMLLRFDLGSGANFRAAAGAWLNANIVGVNGAVNLCATNGAILNIGNVKLEVGTVATPFVTESSQRRMSDCERYFENSTSIGIFLFQISGTTWAVNIPFRTAKRATPTISGITGSPVAPGVGGIAPSGFNTSYGGQTNILTWAASAEI